MKRTMVCVLALCLSLALAACGGSGVPESDTAPVQQTSADTAPNVYAFPVKGGTITVNEDMADALALLGEPQSYFEAPSCAFEGLDKTYTYAGFEIGTYPEGERDIINHIRLTDDSMPTQESIFVGSSAEEVIAAYGESEGDMPNYLTYTRGDSSVNFLIDDGMVISVEYLPN